MDLRKYQEEASKFIDSHEGILQCYTLGLGEEAGEVVKEVTKLWRYANKTEPKDLSSEEKDHIMEEAGDVLWYLMAISHLLGRNIEDLPKHNLDKLHYRRTVKGYQGWFTHILPDADKEFSDAYWEKVRKVQRHRPNSEGMVYHPLFPDHEEFEGAWEFPGIWVKPLDEATLNWLMEMALLPSDIWADYMFRIQSEKVAHRVSSLLD